MIIVNWSFDFSWFWVISWVTSYWNILKWHLSDHLGGIQKGRPYFFRDFDPLPHGRPNVPLSPSLGWKSQLFGGKILIDLTLSHTGKNFATWTFTLLKRAPKTIEGMFTHPNADNLNSKTRFRSLKRIPS